MEQVVVAVAALVVDAAPQALVPARAQQLVPQQVRRLVVAAQGRPLAVQAQDAAQEQLLLLIAMQVVAADVAAAEVDVVVEVRPTSSPKTRTFCEAVFQPT